MSKKDVREKRKTIIVCLLLVVSLAAAGIAGYMLWQGDREYAEGNDVYDAVSAKIHSVKPENSTPPQGESPEQVEIPAMQIDWAALKEINPDAGAWLYCPNTVIDYPVAIAEDYSYYLNHLIDGTRNKNGTLFLDYNCAPDFSDRLSIIYGHHMKSGRMFGTLVKYKEAGYYEEHPYMYLYTEQGNYRINLMYGCVIGAGEWRDKAYMYQENLDSLLEYAKENTTFESGKTYTADDRVIALSTCSYEFEGARYVVIGVLEPEYSNTPGVNANGVN